VGHFGHLNLHQTVYHQGYFKRLLKTLKCFCFDCGKLIFEVSERKIRKVPNNQLNLIIMQNSMNKFEKMAKEVKV
jgi:DNA-directed RNA polymerase beta' subunit